MRRPSRFMRSIFQTFQIPRDNLGGFLWNLFGRKYNVEKSFQTSLDEVLAKALSVLQTPSGAHLEER